MATAKFKKGKDGYYSTNVWDGTYKPNGTKRYKHLRSIKSSKDLEKKVKDFEQLRDQRQALEDTDILFIDYARRWKRLYKESSKANNTNKMYDNVINVHFDGIKYVKLQDVQRKHLQLILNSATGQPRTKQQIAMTFKQVLRSAVADKIYSAQSFAEIFDSFESITYKAKEKRALTCEERTAVFKASFDEMDEIYVYIIYGCGLRCGEALALTEKDFDLKSHTVSINKSHDISNNIPEKKSVKNIKNGERVLPLPDNIYNDVSDYVNKLRSENRKHLFVNRDSKPMTKSGYRRMWTRIIKAMQEVCDTPIEHLTSHIFRHNYCTSLCYQFPKISMKMIAKLVGDSEKVVLEVYNHLMLEKEDTVSAVNDALKMEQNLERTNEKVS